VSKGPQIALSGPLVRKRFFKSVKNESVVQPPYRGPSNDVRFRNGRGRRWGGGLGRNGEELSHHNSQAPSTDQQQFSPPPSGRTSYARAIRGFDPQFRDALVREIATTIATASLLEDAPVCAIRTGETLDALAHCLIATATLCPAFDTPSELRTFSENLAKRIRRTVAQMRADPTFEGKHFFGFRKEGSA
jgi:hypothetical protein